MIRQFVHDLRLAARSLRKQPGLALAAVLTLGLGIGVNSAIFEVVDSVLITPPPFREPGKLSILWLSNPPLAQKMGFPDKLAPSNANFADWRRQSRSFEHLAMMQSDRMRLRGQGAPVQLAVTRVSGDFFSVLGTPAFLGRTLQPADDTLDTPRAVVFSYGFWQRQWGGDPHLIGQRVLLNGNPLTVAGVMPPRFAFPRGAEFPAGYAFDPQPDAWVPLALPAEQRYSRKIHFGLVIGRLRSGVTSAAAQAEIGTLSAQAARAFPETDAGWKIRLLPLTEQMVGDLRPVLLVLWAAVGVVQLIACANVANLLLARAASRGKEIAVRTAIGAGRGRLVKQLLAESGLLALSGGVLGIGLAWATLRGFATVVPPDLAGDATFALNGHLLAFTAGLCLLTTVLAGLAPALQMTRPDLAELLRQGTRGGAGATGGRTRNALVVAEVALAALLLIGGGLLLRTFAQLLAIDPGFRSARLLTFEIDLPPDHYGPAACLRFFTQTLERLQSLPGVDAAGAIDELPLTGFEGLGGIDVQGRPTAKRDEVTVADWHTTFPGYLEVMRIPLRRGRLLLRTDTAAALPVAVIDEGMARTCWPGEEALGKRFHRHNAAMQNNPWITVVGVVGTVRHSSLHADPRPQLYQPAAQTSPDGMPYQVEFAVRSATNAPLALSAAVRSVVREADPDQPIADVRTMAQVVASSLAKRRFSLLLLGLFAALALALSVVGIYGITSYVVVQRTQELGLRMALGAEPGGVLRMVLREAGILVGTGVLLGLAAAFASTRVMSALLYNVGSTDPLTYTAVAAGLTLIALGAAYLPGRRATRVDPLVALRNE